MIDSLDLNAFSGKRLNSKLVDCKDQHLTVVKKAGQSNQKMFGSSGDCATAGGYNRTEDRGSDSTVDFVDSNSDTIADNYIEAGSLNEA